MVCVLVVVKHIHLQSCRFVCRAADLSVGQPHKAPPQLLQDPCKHTSTDDHSGALVQHPALQKGSNWPGTFLSQ
jgi:hypothetical protein